MRIKCTECSNMILEVTAKANNGICGSCNRKQKIVEIRQLAEMNKHETTGESWAHPEPEFTVKIILEKDISKEALLALSKIDLPENLKSIADKLSFIRNSDFIEIGPYEMQELYRIKEILDQVKIEYEVN